MHQTFAFDIDHAAIREFVIAFEQASGGRRHLDLTGDSVRLHARCRIDGVPPQVVRKLAQTASSTKPQLRQGAADGSTMAPEPGNADRSKARSVSRILLFRRSWRAAARTRRTGALHGKVLVATDAISS